MKYAVMFPGQGCQYKKMCEEFYNSDEDFKSVIDKASDILDYDLWNMICNSKMSVFTKSENAQPAVTAVTYALYRKFLKEYKELPAIAFGHSLGEISALICAESISFEDGIDFIKKRGRLMGKINDEKLGFCGIATDITQERMEEIVSIVRKSHYVSITGYNSPKQFMIGGEYEAEKMLDELVSNDDGQYIPYKMIPMKVNAPYHSILTKKFRPVIHDMLKDISFHVPVFPIVSTVSGKLIESAEEIRELLENQLISPVLWNQSVSLMKDMDIDAIIDMGPKEIMKNLVKEAEVVPDVFAFDNYDDRLSLKNRIDGRIKNS